MKKSKQSNSALSIAAAQLAVTAALTGCVSNFSFNQVPTARLSQTEGDTQSPLSSASPSPAASMAPAVPPIAVLPPGVPAPIPGQPPTTPPPAVCDPFSGGKASSARSGLRADLYYEPNVANFWEGWGSLDPFFKNGIKTQSAVYLNELNVPTRHFYQGFQLADGSYLSNDSGDKLFEFFALRIQGQLGLPAGAQHAKTYQLALLSDDGARLMLQQPGQTAPTLFIDNDDAHMTRLACTTQTVTLAPGQRLPMGVDYFQGPRDYIALMLVWREVTPATTASLDPLCGAESNDLFFNTNKTPSAPQGAWLQFLSRGWSVVPAESFSLPETSGDNPCIVNGVGN